MSDDTSEKIWSAAKVYMVSGVLHGPKYRFDRFIFVDMKDLTKEEIDNLTEADINIIKSDFMKDKGLVFSVVYDRVKELLKANNVKIKDTGDKIEFSR